MATAIVHPTANLQTYDLLPSSVWTCERSCDANGGTDPCDTLSVSSSGTRRVAAAPPSQDSVGLTDSSLRLYSDFVSVVKYSQNEINRSILEGLRPARLLVWYTVDSYLFPR